MKNIRVAWLWTCFPFTLSRQNRKNKVNSWADLMGYYFVKTRLKISNQLMSHAVSLSRLMTLGTDCFKQGKVWRLMTVCNSVNESHYCCNLSLDWPTMRIHPGHRMMWVTWELNQIKPASILIKHIWILFGSRSRETESPETSGSWGLNILLCSVSWSLIGLQNIIHPKRWQQKLVVWKFKSWSTLK